MAEAADALHWRLLCLLRVAAPAAKVLECLLRLPPPPEPQDSPADPGEPDPEADGASSCGWLSEAGQAALLELLASDPLLRLLGLPRPYRRSLLKRLLAEVEGRRLALADSLAEGYAETLAEAAGDEAEEGFLYKTFAYGPAPDPDDAPSAQGPSASLPSPLPPEVCERHAARVARGLAGQRGPGGALGLEPGPTRPEAGDAADPPSGPPCGLLSLRLSSNMLAGSTGCHEWEAAFELAERLLGSPELVRGRRVLELGCGCGLVAAVAARLGAAAVAATDGSAQAVANCAANLRLNLDGPVRECGGAQELAGHAEGVCVCQLSWQEPLPPGGLPYDLVLASDVLYDPEAVPVFVGLLERLLTQPAQPLSEEQSSGQEGQGPCSSAAGAGAPSQPRPREVLLASLLRNPATLQLFLATAGERGLRVEALPGAGPGAEGESGLGGGGARAVFHAVPVMEDAGVRGRLRVHRILGPA
ncbi:hypothetical protein HYH03_019101 [Edaphochlamys debaryana]|uniref:Uncharacterized protein n=1 Tax=Edaphochlamys debaryana TaxID=47281 RepID=A0A836BMP4_9CHLO|nr:hypothetical protein HYH03_019101 [Edaphochlamys debaryana]|eukprot:KAG2481947.1 hypothetical protein HYH03_019101 [Edaphochlamys debaryana]